MRFLILKSINNLYSALSLDNGKNYTLRIKGKVLALENSEYNPIAVGDIAIGEPYSECEALLTSREERKSHFTRWNSKVGLNQTIAANQDQTAIVVSSVSPPFRPRFIDRALSSSFGADLLIILNKSDLDMTEEEEERWKLYSELGYETIKVSSVTGKGIEKLKKKYLLGKTTAFVGQSGVGKTTLINTLLGTDERTGVVSDKYNRGRHTTNHSVYLFGENFSLIDTPGVREILTPMEDESLVKSSFPEFKNPGCKYSSCLHDGEDGCVVEKMVEEGLIHYDRYESYLRILYSLRERRPIWERRNNGQKNSKRY